MFETKLCINYPLVSQPHLSLTSLFIPDVNTTHWTPHCPVSTTPTVTPAPPTPATGHLPTRAAVTSRCAPRAMVLVKTGARARSVMETRNVLGTKTRAHTRVML